MGIFTRFRDIVTANINAMLDCAEDPEKMIKLMIREMEDTLIEIKASCATVIASKKKDQRQMEEISQREEYWADKAKLAVEKNRDDLAREALKEKRRYTERTNTLEVEIEEFSEIIKQYQDDMRELEDKLKTAREKQRILVQRHIRAQNKRRAQEDIRRVNSADVIRKFDELENQIERMEAEADLINFGRKSSLEEQLDELVMDDDIEEELNALKNPESDNEDKDSDE